MQKQAVLSLSGGMDSSTLLLHLLDKGYEVTALSFDYGQKHKLELDRAKELVEYINKNIDINTLGYHYPITHQIIKLSGLSNLLNSSLVTGGKEVPEGHYEQENMKDTVVPNRNKIFSSIIQAVALSLATTGEKHEVVIAMGLHAGDHAIYPDCRSEFREADYNAFVMGNWDAHLVSYYTPYLLVNKFEILQDGEKCCQDLGLDFDEIYKKTNTSYKPIHINGNWYSDYKSASSVERIEAFIKLGRPDPVEYGNESGASDWDTAKEFVEQLLLEHKNKQYDRT